MSKKDAVRLDHVTRSYRREDFEVRAPDDVTLQIPEHSFVAIMGPSGSGKTTMLNLKDGDILIVAPPTNLSDGQTIRATNGATIVR